MSAARAFSASLWGSFTEDFRLTVPTRTVMSSVKDGISRILERIGFIQVSSVVKTIKDKNCIAITSEKQSRKKMQKVVK